MIQKLFSGIDLVKVERFRELNPQILERFFARVFTQDERGYIAGSFERAAGIFAAKEALVKALGCGIGPVSWQEVAIRYEDTGRPLPELTGKAKAAEKALGIVEWSVSISHTRNSAVAMAVAYSLADD
ncbi:MAG: holo-ACP synthase [Anaerolineaceae bacterium]|nr:holo-ACP synthase [Anaerolineaceae bacterium]